MDKRIEVELMNEEEKKAIRNLENLSEYGLSTTLNQADLDKMKIVLNLITKLQKENEELKSDNLEKSRILEVFDDKKYRKKYLEERRKEEPNLLYPDGDEIYKRYYEQKKQIDLLVERIYQAYFNEDDFWNWFGNLIEMSSEKDYLKTIKQYFEKLVKEKG